jgi:hypothetical protein
MGSLLGASLLGLAAWLSAGRLPGVVGVLGLAGLAALAVGLALRRGTLVTASLGLVGTCYAVSLVGRGLDAASPLYAGGLLLVAELAFWALEPGARIRLRQAATRRRALFSGGLAVAATVVGAVLLGVSSARVGSGAELEVAGLVALAVVVSAAVWLIHSLRTGVR